MDNLLYENTQESQVFTEESESKQGKQKLQRFQNKESSSEKSKIDQKLEQMLQDPECEEVSQQNLALEFQNSSQNFIHQKSEDSLFPEDLKAKDLDENKKSFLSSCCFMSEACNVF